MKSVDFQRLHTTTTSWQEENTVRHKTTIVFGVRRDFIELIASKVFTLNTFIKLRLILMRPKVKILLVIKD